MPLVPCASGHERTHFLRIILYQQLPVDCPREGAFLNGYSVLQAPPTMSFSSNTSTCADICDLGLPSDHPTTDSLLITRLDTLPRKKTSCDETIVSATHDRHIRR